VTRAARAAESALSFIRTRSLLWLGARAVKQADEQGGPIAVVATPQMDFWIGQVGLGRPMGEHCNLTGPREAIR